VGALGRELVNRALEGIERVLLAAEHNLEASLIVVPADVALGHGHRKACIKRAGRAEGRGAERRKKKEEKRKKKKESLKPRVESRER
jgi:hypothetical protein